MKEEIARLLKEGIIRKSNPSFASPCFPIVKKNGKIRLIVDYRELNRCTITDSYLFPNITDQLLELDKHTICSQIDLRKDITKSQLAKNRRN